jgi:Tol biopolymer transport system component
MTGAGVLLGTAAYMSPEQTKGRAADRRSDIWAFGCVLYEMHSGARPFEGEDINETIAAIRRASPDWTRLPADTPLSIRRLLRRCLEKDRRERLPDIGAARLDIKEAQANVDVDPAAPVAAASPSHRRLATLGWALASVMTVVALGLAGTMYRWPATPDTRVYRSSIVPHANLSGDPASRLAISPDGRRLAFLAPGGGNYTMVWVRALDGATAQSLAGTEGATHPFWSPDSRFIAFTAGGKLKKIEAAGGPALTICDSESFGRGTWNRDDIILFSPRRLGPIHRVHAGGGTPEPVMPLDANAGETAHRHPYFLPDGRHFLFTAYQAIVPAGLFVTSMDDTRRTRLMDGGSNAAYAQGFLLFLRDGTLLAQPFDAGTLTLTADARPVAEGVVTQPERAGTFSVSETGALVYQTSGVGDRQLAWTNRQGTVTGTVDSRRAGYQTVELSPDGTRAAASVIADTGDAEDIWVIDLTRSVPMRLTTDPASDRFPIWSPDGSHIVFQSNRRNGIFDLYQRPASGAGADEVLWADGEYKVPTSWSADGRFILYTSNTDIWVLPLEAAATTGPARAGGSRPIRLMETRFNESEGEFSPDGRMVAYTSNESGQPQVYVTPFPGAGARWPITSSGSARPRWRRDGRELFYETRPEGILTAAMVSSAGARLEVGGTSQLFKSWTAGNSSRRWDVASEGQKFLFVLENAGSEIVPITLVVNWQAALGARESR